MCILGTAQLSISEQHIPKGCVWSTQTSLHSLPSPRRILANWEGRKGCLLAVQGAGLLLKADGSAQNKLFMLTVSQRAQSPWPSHIPLLVLTQQLQKMGVAALAAGRCPQSIPQPFPSSFPSAAGSDALTAQLYPTSLQLAVFLCSGIPNGNFGLWAPASPYPAGTSAPGEAWVLLAQRCAPASPRYTPLWMQLRVFSLHFWLTRLILQQPWGMDWRQSDAQLVHPTASAYKHKRGWLYANACLALTVIT